MSRKKTEINPIRADRLKTLIDASGITQKQLADRIYQSQQNISRIIQKRQPLTEETARLIISAFPDFRIEWLLGYDDIMKKQDLIPTKYEKMRIEKDTLERSLFELIRLSDFSINLRSIENLVDLHDFLKKYCTITRDGKTITFSVEDLNRFENEICDYIEFRLLHMMK